MRVDLQSEIITLFQIYPHILITTLRLKIIVKRKNLRLVVEYLTYLLATQHSYFICNT